MIKLQIVGNLGKDCIMKEVNGRNVINFSVAHTERYKDAQGTQKVDARQLRSGLWNVRLQWTLAGQEYFVDRPLVLPALHRPS